MLNNNNQKYGAQQAEKKVTPGSPTSTHLGAEAKWMLSLSTLNAVKSIPS